jgi:hypothetical protein
MHITASHRNPKLHLSTQINTTTHHVDQYWNQRLWAHWAVSDFIPRVGCIGVVDFDEAIH